MMSTPNAIQNCANKQRVLTAGGWVSVFDDEIIFEGMQFREVEPHVSCKIDKDDVDVETPESVNVDSYRLENPQNSLRVHKSVIVVDAHRGKHISTIHSGEIERERIDEILSEPREMYVLEHIVTSNSVDVTRIK